MHINDIIDELYSIDRACMLWYALLHFVIYFGRLKVTDSLMNVLINTKARLGY